MGPTGEVLFDQVFNATGSQGLQGEQDLLLPLGDHQHSTRVVLAHDAGDATYVRQSLDYAQFGRVTTVLGANGLADTGGVVTAFAHHGSLLDAATGLQHKGERWYSPDLGRFVSEDPIQDGSNWYDFAGNDPVNFADPSGLSQQGHPLGGEVGLALALTHQLFGADRSLARLFVVGCVVSVHDVVSVKVSGAFCRWRVATAWNAPSGKRPPTPLDVTPRVDVALQRVFSPLWPS